jgi:membrane-bound ClpP family serine protease
MVDEPLRRPPAFVASCVLGLVGAILIVAGLFTGTEALALAGVAAGALSLGAAMYWRAQLIEAWREQQRGQ